MATNLGNSSSCDRVVRYDSTWLRFTHYSIAWKIAVGSVAVGWRNRDSGGAVTIDLGRRAERSSQHNATAGANSSKPSLGLPELNMPDFKSEIRACIAGLNLSAERELEIIEELSQHLDEQYEYAISRGASEEEAKRAALE